MSKPETRFRNSIRDKFKSKFSVMQIESGLTAPGVPDTHLLLNGTNKTAWLELKCEPNFPYKVGLEKTQVPWLRKYCRSGGKAFVVLKIEDTADVYVWPGHVSKELYHGGKLRILPYAVFHTKKRNEWRAFVEYIKREIE